MESAIGKLLSHRLRGFDDVELTLAGMREACRHPPHRLEIDVRITVDGQIVVHHDPVTATGTKIAATQLEDLDVTRFDELLEIFASESTDHILCIDIKDFGVEAALIDKVASASLERRVEFVSWMPQSLLAIREIAGSHYPLVLSSIPLLRFGAIGSIASRWGRNALFRFGPFAVLGESTFDRDLQHLATGYQHGYFWSRLPDSLTERLVESGGGICIHRFFMCASLAERCSADGLQLWVFGVPSIEEHLRQLDNPAVDVIFSEDARTFLNTQPSSH